MSRAFAASVTLALTLAVAPTALGSEGREQETSGVEPTSSVAVDWSATGPYVAVGGGMAFADLGAGATGAGTRFVYMSDQDTESGSVSLRAGYRLYPRIAAEVLWDYQTGWEFLANQRDAVLTAWSLTANLKAYLTETRWQPFVVAGIGLGRRETDTKLRFFDPSSGEARSLHDVEEAFVARLGLGLEVHLQESWSLGGEAVYVLGTGDLHTLDYTITSLVLTYRFR